MENSKQSIRSEILNARKRLTTEQVVEDSRCIVKKIEDLQAFIQARYVALYMPIQNEVDVSKLLQYRNSKSIYLPVCDEHNMTFYKYEGEECMTRGKFGIMEPDCCFEEEGIDVVLVPGVAFDLYGNRLGRGGGFYDKWLQGRTDTYKIGVCYDFQIVHYELPHQAHDVKMDIVIHPNM